MNWAFDAIAATNRKARQTNGDFCFAVWIREPLDALEVQAANAEREAIRRWNERRFFRELRRLADELETVEC